MKPKKKRQQRRQRGLENDFNTNGFSMDSHVSGTFRVYDKKTKENYRGLNWEQAVKLWNELGSAIILNH